jgi:hypothetical protein
MQFSASLTRSGLGPHECCGFMRSLVNPLL